MLKLMVWFLINLLLKSLFRQKITIFIFTILHQPVVVAKDYLERLAVEVVFTHPNHELEKLDHLFMKILCQQTGQTSKFIRWVQIMHMQRLARAQPWMAKSKGIVKAKKLDTPLYYQMLKN
uniref:Putative secreted protein n=1 Tax=Xenopsylla cheopis TaxID=163159 RepID=A0A6M2DYK4_XENCH